MLPFQSGSVDYLWTVVPVAVLVVIIFGFAEWVHIVYVHRCGF